MRRKKHIAIKRSIIINPEEIEIILMKHTTVIVTGATGTIGTAVCKKLLESGYFVIAVSRTSPKKVIKDIKICYRQLDVSDPKAVEVFFKERLVVESVLAGVVTCAGLLKMGPTHEFTDTDWNNLLQVNTSGTFYIFKHAIKHMREHQNIGVLIAIGSRWNNGAKEATAYATSKSALQGMIRSLQKELTGTAIRPMIVSPGSVESSMSSSVNNVINKKIIQPTDIADLISYLFTTPQRIIFNEITMLAYNYDLEDQHA